MTLCSVRSAVILRLNKSIFNQGLTSQYVGNHHCRPCAAGSIPPRPSGGYLLHAGPAARRTPGSQTGQPHVWQPYLHTGAEKVISQQQRLLVDEQGSLAVTASLTGEVDGVQADSSGSDETSDPLQLPVFHVVLEDDVIGEVHAAGRLGRG